MTRRRMCRDGSDIDAEALAFSLAMRKEQERLGRPGLSWREVWAVALKMGYRRVSEQVHHAAAPTGAFNRLDRP